MFFTVNNYHIASLKFKALANAGAQLPGAHPAQEPGGSLPKPLSGLDLRKQSLAHMVCSYERC